MHCFEERQWKAKKSREASDEGQYGDAVTISIKPVLICDDVSTAWALRTGVRRAGCALNAVRADSEEVNNLWKLKA